MSFFEPCAHSVVEPNKQMNSNKILRIKIGLLGIKIVIRNATIKLDACALMNHKVALGI
jgi:hypothetical protein